MPKTSRKSSRMRRKAANDRKVEVAAAAALVVGDGQRAALFAARPHVERRAWYISRTFSKACQMHWSTGVSRQALERSATAASSSHMNETRVVAMSSEMCSAFLMSSITAAYSASLLLWCMMNAMGTMVPNRRRDSVVSSRRRSLPTKLCELSM